jgi:hypothetical protein
MFFRVLSAMVVADAIDRRARRPPQRWPAPPTANAWRNDDGYGSRAAYKAVEVTAVPPAWDRSAPERPHLATPGVA